MNDAPEEYTNSKENLPQPLSREEGMAIYDALPPRMRHMLRYAPINSCPGQAERFMEVNKNLCDMLGDQYLIHELAKWYWQHMHESFEEKYTFDSIPECFPQPFRQTKLE